jgi:hypothetical protein
MLMQHKEKLKNYQKHFHYLFDICCLNLYLLCKQKRWQHFQDGILSETYRKFNFKISCNGKETVRHTTMNAAHYSAYVAASYGSLLLEGLKGIKVQQVAEKCLNVRFL